MAEEKTTVVATEAPRPARPPVKFEQQGGLVPTTFDEAYRMAKIMAESGMVPKDYKDKPEACFVAMQMGAEVGLKPMQSLQNIAVINGRPAIWGDALWALVQSHPSVEDAFETFNPQGMIATCTIKRRDRSTPTVVSFSMEDAKTAGLWGKGGPWTTNPKRMLQMRARSFAARDAVPEALKGICVAEEAIDIPLEREVSGSAEFVEQPKRRSATETLERPTPKAATEASTDAWHAPQSEDAQAAGDGRPEGQAGSIPARSEPDAIPRAASFVDGPAFGQPRPTEAPKEEPPAIEGTADIVPDDDSPFDDDPPFPVDNTATPSEPAPRQPATGPAMSETQKNILRNRLARAALTEVDLGLKFGKLDELKASEFNAVQDWIKSKAR